MPSEKTTQARPSESGMPELPEPDGGHDDNGTPIYLQRQIFEYARLVAEECAKVCDSVNNYDNPMTALDCSDAIRAKFALKTMIAARRKKSMRTPSEQQ